MQKENPYVLPKYAKPLRYDLELEPDISAGTCQGRETILLKIEKSTKEIQVNVNDVKVHTARIGKEPAQSITYDEKLQRVICKFATTIPKGKVELFLTFESKVRDDLRGFYKSTYEVNGQKRTMATTQFEATDARRCFPCFDEPALKAKFSITFIIPKELAVISNMPVKRETEKNNKKRVVFEESPIMSTYLLAFLVGEFEGIQRKTNHGATVGVWTTPGKKRHGEFALDTAVKVLEYYERYFGVPYPLPKLDLIAIPDFESGAMENWGAVTYRERALLHDPAHSSAAGKEQVATVIAHELAHQWFGNLVTMRWWNDLWLNEGFASWMEYKAVHHLFPEWEMWIQFTTDEQGVGFGLDGFESSHPIEVEVVNPADIDEIFDAVSYNKGASVIHMLEQYLGEETFRKGLRQYLNKFKYGNATTKDLWESLAAASKKPVQKIMDTWTKQTGYPVVSAQAKEKEIALAQERYFFSGRKKDSTLWCIPLAITQGKETKYHMMEKRQENIPRGKGLTLLNKNQVGFYRLLYDAALFQEQIKAFQEKQLGTLDKIGLVANTFALAESNYTKMDQFLDVLRYVRDETNYTLWADVAGSISQLQMLFAHHAFSDDLDALCRWVFARILKKVGWEEKKGESHTQILLRSSVMGMTGFSKEESVRAEAKKRFQEYLKTKTLSPNIRGVVYSLAAWTGDAETWEQLRQMHEAETLQEEKIRIVAAMCMFQQQELLRKTLEYSLSPAVRAQDSPIGVARIARNPFGMDLAWEFLKEQWPEFMKRYGAGGHLLGKIIQAVTSGFSTPEKATDVKAFFKQHPVPHTKRAIEQSLENIAINHQFVKRHEVTVASWLKAWKQKI